MSALIKSFAVVYAVEIYTYTLDHDEICVLQ